MDHRFPLSRICQPGDWQYSPLAEAMVDITGCAQSPALAHRKAWEFGLGALALEAGRVLHDEAVGISTGAGHEAILYWLANRVSVLHATDIYGEGDFSGGESSSHMLSDQTLFAPYAYRQNALRVKQMNALNLEFDTGSLDFAISFGSIEHFGGKEAARTALREMARVVRPGGIVFFTTEVVVDGRAGVSLPGLELFDQEFLTGAVDSEPGVTWLGPVDLRPPPPGDPVVDLVNEIERIELGVQTYPHRRIGVVGPDCSYRHFTSVSIALLRAEGFH